MPVIALAESEGVHAAMRSRLAAARRTYEGERPAELRLDVGRLFTQTYLLKLSTLLPLTEVSVILAAEDMREQALALIRNGEIAEGGKQLQRAAALCDASPLSDHARLAARSFQSAANAYLAYRQRRHGDAIRDLEEAILACDDLDRHFDDAMEFRRIHLARNLLRVQSHIGASERIVADSVELLFYIVGDTSRWPLAVGRGCGGPARLSVAQRGCAIDETIINLALRQVDIGAGRSFVPRFVHRQGLDVHLFASFEWCDAVMASRARDERSVARHAINFYGYRCYDLVQAGKALAAIVSDPQLPV